jgi:hypothetical protein
LLKIVVLTFTRIAAKGGKFWISQIPAKPYPAPRQPTFGRSLPGAIRSMGDSPCSGPEIGWKVEGAQ